MKTFVKLLFFTVLALNIGYYAVRGMNAEPPEREISITAPGVPKLVLIREREEDLLSTEGDLGNGSSTGCYAIGPFRTQSDLRVAFNQLAPVIKRSRQRQEVRNIDRGYWVYLPAMQSRIDALNVARELSQIGLQDYYVVTAGTNENTISMGLYRDEENARKRQGALVRLGYEAQMSRRLEETLVYWLDYRENEPDDTRWRQIIAGRQNIDRKPVPCFK